MKWIITICIVGVLLISAHASGYRINLTNSLSPGIYKESSDTPQRGDLASFCLTPENEYRKLVPQRHYLGESFLCPSGQKPLLKRLVGISGDNITVYPKALRVNKTLYTISTRNYDRNRKPLPHKLRSGIIPNGKALMLSTYNPDSFDSRYFGLVDASSLRKVIPIITIN